MERKWSDSPTGHMCYADDRVVFKNREFEMNTAMAEHSSHINSRDFSRNLATHSHSTYLGYFLSFHTCSDKYHCTRTSICLLLVSIPSLPAIVNACAIPAERREIVAR